MKLNVSANTKPETIQHVRDEMHFQKSLQSGTTSICKM